MESFLKRCVYVSGQYDSEDDFARLASVMAQYEAPLPSADRLFYLSIPPNIFNTVAAGASRAASSPSGWTRMIVEKPFGRDLESFRALSRQLYEHFDEEQI